MLETFQTAGFWIAAILAILAAWRAITGRNLVHNVLFLGLFLLMVASFYFFLQSDFIAVVQILIYIGGVVTLLLFGIMLTFKITDTKVRQVNTQAVPSLLAVLVLLAFLLSSIQGATFVIVSKGPGRASVPIIGKLLLNEYLLPFEVIGFILLAAIVGAVIIAKEEKGK